MKIVKMAVLLVVICSISLFADASDFLKSPAFIGFGTSVNGETNVKLVARIEFNINKQLFKITIINDTKRTIKFSYFMDSIIFCTKDKTLHEVEFVSVNYVIPKVLKPGSSSLVQGIIPKHFQQNLDSIKMVVCEFGGIGFVLVNEKNLSKEFRKLKEKKRKEKDIK